MYNYIQTQSTYKTTVVLYLTTEAQLVIILMVHVIKAVFKNSSVLQICSYSFGLNH